MMFTAAAAGLALGVGSAVHCAGMCGPLAALACQRGRASRSWASYLGGRLLSYTAVGALLGGLTQGATVWLRGPWVGALASWTLALSLGLSALWLWRGGPRGPSLVALRRPGRGSRLLDAVVARLRRWPAALVGAGQALLPCGALAAASLVAAGQGSVLGGATAMAGFAAASSVGLLLPGLAGRLAIGFGRPLAVRGLAVVLAVGAAWMAVRPMSALRADAGSSHPASCPMHQGASHGEGSR